jgi:hypothetical protein
VDIPMSVSIHDPVRGARDDRSLGALEHLAPVARYEAGDLLEMADRSRVGPSHPVYLPMSRYDIADYLGLAAETVSRALTELRQRHAITFRSVRQVRICDRPALQELAEKMAEPAIPAPARGSTVRAARYETNRLST